MSDRLLANCSIDQLERLFDEKRAQKEYEEVLERTGMTPERLREREEPAMRRATYRVPRYGVAGTAANYALHLARC